jgi:hypothetical protein
MGEGASTAKRQVPVAGFVLMLLSDIIAPVALYYVLRLAGVGQLVALLLSGTPLLLRNIALFVRRRRVDGFSLFVLTVVLLGAAVSLITGSSRLLLIRDGWFTAFLGIVLLGSMFVGRPLTYLATITLLPHKETTLERLWQTEPGFRRVWYALAVIWGTVTLLDAGIRVLMAYSLPIDTVPALDTALSIATFVLLQGITQVMLFRNPPWRSMWPRRPARPSPSR